jgi:hypothetical protein
MTTKQFHIGTILTVTDGKFIAPGGIGDVYGICDWMTGESNFTHQLPRVSREIEPILRERFPDLAAIVVPEGLDSWDKVNAYLASLEPEFGTHRDVAPLAAEDHTSIDPISEIKMLRPDLPIVAVTVDPTDRDGDH